MQHTRAINAVGQGGMSIEVIGGFRVMYDCGSTSHQMRVIEYIDAMVEGGCHHIDCLVLSHYDKDHVNSIEYLLKRIKVVRAIVPLVPIDVSIVFDAATGGAYSQIMALLNQNNCQVSELGDTEGTNNITHTSENIVHDLWRWDVHTMIKFGDWQKIKEGLNRRGFDLKKISDFAYVASKLNIINTTFRSLWRSQGSNGKGLIMLSQKTENANILEKSLSYGKREIGQNKCNNTGCLYVGDANLNNKSNVREIKGFIARTLLDQHLHLMQVPHHGSKYNVNEGFYNDFVSDYYFICDKDINRVKKNPVIWPLNNRTMMVTYSRNTRILDFSYVQ